MSRYTGSIFKKSRKFSISLLENNKEFSKGKKRTTPPGQHGNKSNFKKPSLYGKQLAEKQKISLLYAVKDKQLRRFFKLSKKMDGKLSMNLLILLESRLDNLVFRMGFSPTRRGARQLVSHGHVLVNGKKCDIPSAIIPLNSFISIKEKSKDMKLINDQNEVEVMPFVSVDKNQKVGQYIRFPERKELHPEINEVYVVEWYKQLI